VTFGVCARESGSEGEWSDRPSGAICLQACRPLRLGSVRPAVGRKASHVCGVTRGSLGCCLVIGADDLEVGVLDDVVTPDGKWSGQPERIVQESLLRTGLVNVGADIASSAELPSDPEAR
jgi:hypothetical protein